jgi:hypothetical protein
MAKQASREAFYERLRTLSEVNKVSVKESKSRNLGTLIDYKRAVDGVAYGIIKENHQYYIKKAGIKKDPNVSDFAYIGGMENVTGYQFKSLSEADKQRNMMFHTIGEAKGLTTNKTSSKMILREDMAGKEIDKAASKIPDLDAATSAGSQPPAPEGDAEMDAGIAADTQGTAEIPTPAPEGGGDAGMPAPEGGDAGMPDMGDETPAPEGDDEMPAPEGDDETPDMGGEEGGEETQLQKDVSGIGEEIKNSDLENSDSVWLLKRFIQAFTPEEGEEGNPKADKMSSIPISDRQEIADLILNVVSDKDTENLGQNVEDTEARAGMEEAECSECGNFAKYAESRGY